MERNGRRMAAPTLKVAAIVRLTSREGDARYWYDPGDVAAASLAAGAGRAYRLDRFGCGEDGVEGAWSFVDPRLGH
jgi:hypothetical protein